MRYRKLTEDGDMTFGNQQRDFWIDQPEAVSQAIWTRLRLWQGEWYIDTSEGTPYQESALGTNKQATIEPAIRTQILGTQGVTQIDDLQTLTNSKDRLVTIFAVVDTEYGTVKIEGVQ